ncbi:helix-turn-helix domain-containing protein [Gluconobacter japonicus]|uniref:helix-turn-helix domain-containing protein n=1 Tax=Gluconobacter japonicus TaxID=376620 RepID=UPI0009ECBEAD|nr:helix-turn-helix transcriptional regulator [Gluconobacter japonicus]
MNASKKGTYSAIITPGQVRAARAFLGWSQDELSERSKVPKRTLIRFEMGEGIPRLSTIAALQDTLERAGQVFSDGDGVKDTTKWFVLPHGESPKVLDLESRITITRKEHEHFQLGVEECGRWHGMFGPPEGGYHKHSYAKDGDSGLIVDIRTRTDKDYGHVSQVKFVPDER